MTDEMTKFAETLRRLRDTVGDDHVLTGRDDREFFSMDAYRARELALAVVQPGTIEELQAVVRIASAEQLALVPRGGGASYSDAFLPATTDSLLIDTRRLNRIVEINADDMYITVEPGITWAEMTEALAEQGLRTAFWGPFSGLKATVGGSITQNAVSLGSGNYGCSADSVLSFDVILGNGEILSTGSAALNTASRFFRHYGPDLTGIFTGDAGAFGIKARIAMRLVPKPKHSGTASFGFNTYEMMADGMAAVARLGIAADCFGLDPKLQQGQLGSTTTADAIRAAVAVLRTSTNPFDGFMRLVKMAIAGKRFLTGFDYSAHYVVEGSSRAEIKAKLREIRSVMSSEGTEIANTIPTVLRAMPFMPLLAILGPEGERWVPMHGILPFSKIKEFHNRITELHQANQARMEELDIVPAAMFTSISTNGFLYEPVFYWRDDRTTFHKRYLPQDHLDTLPEYPPNPEGRVLVEELRQRIQKIFTEMGAVHMQVGKSYPYMAERQPTAEKILRDIKQSLDPETRMNPGALDL